MPENPPWPTLTVESWQPTRDTLTLWLQIIGKIRIARTPLLNHWWNAPLYLTASGVTTSLIPADPGRSFSVDFDFIEHRLHVRTTLGQLCSMELFPMTVRDFYIELMALLEALDLGTEIWPVPVELPDAIPFPDDTVHAAYDPRAVTAFWRTLVEVERVFNEFRAGFVGKSSPVHLFWGALDLASTRFSGRPAPLHPGGMPNCGPHVMQEGRRGHLLRLLLPGAGRLPHHVRRSAGGAFRQGARGVRSSVHRRANRPGPGRTAHALPAKHLRSGGDHRPLGPRLTGEIQT